MNFTYKKMTQFVCESCRYRFKSQSDQKGKKCPYCNKTTIIKEPSAEDIIRDLDID